MPSGFASWRVLLIVELFDHVVLRPVDVEIQAIVDVVDMGGSEAFFVLVLLSSVAQADQRAVGRGVPGARMIQRAGQTNFRYQAAVVPKSPAIDVMVATQVINVPQRQLLAVGPPVSAFVRQSGGFFVQHNHEPALLLSVGIKRLTPQTAGYAVFAGENLFHLLGNAPSKIRGSGLAAIVRDENLRQAGILQHRAVAKADVRQHHTSARMDRPFELPAFPLNRLRRLARRRLLCSLALPCSSREERNSFVSRANESG